MRTQIEKLVSIFKNNTDQTVLVDILTGTPLTYGQLCSHAMKFAQTLASKGFTKGDKVGILLGNCPEYAVIYFALMHLGAVPVPINPGLHPDEIKFVLDYSDVKIIYVAQSLKMRFDGLFKNFTHLEIIFLKLEADKIKQDQRSGGLSLLDELKDQRELQEDFLGSVEDEDVAAIMYTSGTTSYPKGVVIGYRNVIANGLLFVQTTKIPKGSRFLAVFSQAYMGGWYNAMLIPILSQGTVVLDDTFGSNTALNFWDKVLTHQISALWLTPTMMSILLFTGKVNHRVLDYCKRNIKSAFVGTAPLPPRLKKDFEKNTGIVFYENYGLSETFFISTNCPGPECKDGSVGMVLPGCEVEIRGDNAQRCPVGEEGEIFVKSSYMMKGYYKDKSDFVLDPRGFFATGDLGVFDQEGNLFITGRKKDLIIRGGLNISSKQIEDKLMDMGTIAGIACVGVPHNIYGEEVAVVVKLKEEFKDKVTEKDILDFARKNLAQAKYPRIVCFVDDFPRSSTGKIQKNKLRIMLKEKYVN